MERKQRDRCAMRVTMRGVTRGCKLKVSLDTDTNIPQSPQTHILPVRATLGGGLKSSLLLSFFFSLPASHVESISFFSLQDPVCKKRRSVSKLSASRTPFFFFLIFFFFFSRFVCLIPFCRRSCLRVPRLCLKETGGRSSVRRVVFWHRSLDTP